MTNRGRALAVLNYQPYDRLPVVHFGFWGETLANWAAEGHLTAEEARGWGDGNVIERQVSAKLGFDFNYYTVFHLATNLRPGIEPKVLEVLPDGSRKYLDGNGAVVIQKDGAGSIPAHVDHLLKDRKSWEEIFLPKLQFSEERVTESMVLTGEGTLRFDQGGREFLAAGERDYLYGLHCGSLYGNIRNWLGMENTCYLLVDDEALFDEIIDTVGELCFKCVEFVLGTGAQFDFAHFWEDVCFKNGPLISPSVFEEKVGPHYKRITDLVNRHGMNVVSLDCDGKIDALVPTWFNNGVNTMFPIEVGTWGANIQPWREQFGRELRGVGGMNKTLFAYDRPMIDKEIERLKPLVALGGFIPCPDHRIAPDAKWDNVRYYCDRMREIFG